MGGSIIDSLAENKIQILEESLERDKEYRERQERVNHATKQMAKSGLSDEQSRLVDELVCAHVAQQNYLNVCMYKEGFLDFVEIYAEAKRAMGGKRKQQGISDT